MIEIINSILNEIGESIGKWLGTEINWMTLESLTFVIFVPCAWLMGIPYEEVTIAANVLAKACFKGRSVLHTLHSFEAGN